MSDAIIQVRHIDKRFRIPHTRRETLRERLFSFGSRMEYEEYHALNDVSFEIEKGQFFGVIGRNGSGKSTLLKMLAGVYSPDNGEIEMRGSVSPFLELGVGFQGELTAGENVYLNGTMLGMSRAQIDAAFDDIFAFAELERFVDSKLKNFSSGMVVRLAFAVAVRAKADILILDEVLAVGDAAFQEKCFGVFEQLKSEGTTIILVSHSEQNIEKFCDAALLLDKGEVVAVGPTKQVLYEYRRVLREDEEAQLEEGNTAREQKQTSSTRWGDGKATITNIALLDKHGKPATVFQTGDALRVRVEYDVHETVTNPNFAVAVYRSTDQLYCYDINTYLDAMKLEPLTKAGHFELEFPALPLLDGTYYLKVGLFSDYCDNTHDFFDQGPQFSMESPENAFGTVLLEHNWHLSSHA